MPPYSAEMTIAGNNVMNGTSSPKAGIITARRAMALAAEINAIAYLLTKVLPSIKARRQAKTFEFWGFREN
jgi:hypothetical protein